MFKKILAGLVCLSMLATACYATKDMTAAKTTPTLDGVITEGEYGGEAWLLDKSYVESVNGVCAGEMTDDTYLEVYTSWDDNGLYMGFVCHDITQAPASTDVTYAGDGADVIQIAFHSEGDSLVGGRWFGLSAYQNGEFAAITYYAADEDTYMELPGAAMLGNGTMTIETYFTWDVLEYGHDDSSEGLRYEYKEGTGIVTMIAYKDFAATGDGDYTIRYKNCDVDVWPTSDDITDKIVLSAAPAEETPADEPEDDEPADEEPADVDPAPATADLAVVAIAALGAFAVAKSKKR